MRYPNQPANVVEYLRRLVHQPHSLVRPPVPDEGTSTFRAPHFYGSTKDGHLVCHLGGQYALDVVPAEVAVYAGYLNARKRPPRRRYVFDAESNQYVRVPQGATPKHASKRARVRTPRQNAPLAGAA